MHPPVGEQLLRLMCLKRAKAGQLVVWDYGIRDREGAVPVRLGKFSRLGFVVCPGKKLPDFTGPYYH